MDAEWSRLFDARCDAPLLLTMAENGQGYRRVTQYIGFLRGFSGGLLVAEKGVTSVNEV